MDDLISRSNKKPDLLIPFSIGHCANDLVPIAMYIVIPAFGSALDLSPAKIGLLFMIHNFASIAYFPAGLLSDHAANRGIFLVGTFFWTSIGYFIASFADSFWSFAFLIALAGMGDAAWHPIATGVLAQIHKTRRAFALGVFAIGGHLSEVIALPIAGFLLTAFDWRITMQIMVIPTAIVGCIFVFVAAKVPRQVKSWPNREDFNDIWNVWSSKKGISVIALFTAYNMGLFAITAMAPLYLRSAYELSWLATAIAMASMMLPGALLQPLMGKVSDKIGRRPLIIFGNAVAACAAFLAGLSSTLVISLLTLGIALTLLVGIRSVLLATAVDHADSREGTSLGLTFAFMDGFAASAAVLAGLAGERDLSNAFLLASSFSLLATFLAILLPKGSNFIGVKHHVPT